jgi:DNA-binding transcriptional LysR family regulator
MNESPTDLALFVAVAESGRLAQAARLLGITAAGASAALKRLEAQLGVKLVLRSTRQLRLTLEGERYLPYAREALAALRAGREALRGDDAALAGWVRIAAPADLGRNALMPILRQFAERHPAVRFQLALEDSLSDFFAAPVDLALRYGALADSRLVAQPLRRLQRVLCAAPAYAAAHGVPATPEQLPQHATLCYMQQQRAVTRWRLQRGDDRRDIEVAPRWVFNDAEMVRRWALRGMGIAYRVSIDVAEDIKAGRLLRVLPDWHGEPVALSLVYPDRRLSPLLRAMTEHLVAALAEA